MKTMQWTFADRTGWQPGPWDSEPDKMQWMDEATRLPCLIRRGPSGALCGYVGVQEEHQLHGKGYNTLVAKPAGFDNRVLDATTGIIPLLLQCAGEFADGVRLDAAMQVHGGLTFACGCSEQQPNGYGICHIPDQGEPDTVWWFGFDCQHAGDVCPGHGRNYPGFGNETYRDLAYVKQQCANLAAQLKEFTA